MRRGGLGIGVLGSLLLSSSQASAAALGPFLPVQPVLLGITALFYAIGAIVIVYGGGKGIMSLVTSTDRRDMSDGIWGIGAAVLAGVVMFLIIPALAGTGAALAMVP